MGKAIPFGLTQSLVPINNFLFTPRYHLNGPLLCHVFSASRQCRIVEFQAQYEYAKTAAFRDPTAATKIPMPSIFTKILRGEVPASIVHRDERVVAFLDINPLSEGHTLVVPVEEVSSLSDLDPETLTHLTLLAQQIGEALRKSDPSVTGVNWLLCDGRDAGQEVFHIHLHVIPRRVGDGLRLGGKSFKAKRTDLDSWATRIGEALAVREADL